MAKPDEVTILSAHTAPVFDAQGRLTNGTTYTYTVSGQGPFTLTVGAVDDNPDNVCALLAQKVANLRAIGVDV